jgi:hypothetical protein
MDRCCSLIPGVMAQDDVGGINVESVVTISRRSLRPEFEGN